MAGAAARDEDGEEEAASEASSVPPLTSDDSDVDDAADALPEEAKLRLQEGKVWLVDEEVAVRMMATWAKMTPRQIEEQTMEMGRIMQPVVRGHKLVQLLQSQLDRPAKANPPQRGKHTGPRISRAGLVWLQAVTQAQNLLPQVAETLGTSYEALKADLISMSSARDSYDSMWQLLQPALRMKPLLVLEYQALWLLFQATDDALHGETRPQVEASIIITSEQLINTTADMSGLPREHVATLAAQHKEWAYLIAWVWMLSRTTGYLDFDTQTASGWIRSDVPVWYCG